MTRFTNIGRIRRYNSTNLRVDPIHEKHPVGRPSGNNLEEIKRIKNDKRTRLRRFKRMRESNDSLICYRCRRRGHALESCPEVNNIESADVDMPQSDKICYRCGSGSHTLSSCRSKARSKGNDLPFVSCFICNKMGHLAVSCPKNDHGIYPEGGTCHLCNSTEHLAAYCKMSAKKKIEKGVGSTMLGEMNLEQGADDDDLHLTLRDEPKNARLVRNPRREKVVTM